MKLKISFPLWLLLITCIIGLSLSDLRAFIPISWPHQDKLFHILAFAVLIPLTQLTFKKVPLFFILFGAFLFGLLLEFSQLLFSSGTRQYDANDLVFNLLGIGFGLLVLLFARYWIIRNKT